MAEQKSSRTETGRLAVPKIRTDKGPCGDRGPRYSCNRPAGHTGRHSFYWQHIDGRVRAVWPKCHGRLLPGSYCASCGTYQPEGDV